MLCDGSGELHSNPNPRHTRAYDPADQIDGPCPGCVNCEATGAIVGGDLHETYHRARITQVRGSLFEVLWVSAIYATPQAARHAARKHGIPNGARVEIEPVPVLGAVS